MELVFLLVTVFVAILPTESVPDLFHISAIPSQSRIRKNNIQNVSILFEIDSSDSTSFERQSNELALVLDISGSMTIGNRIFYAKTAIKQVVTDLIEGDILHLIVYSSDAEVLFKNGDKSQISNILRQIDEIEAGGSTNMYGGLRKAYKILKKNGKKRKEEDGKIGMNQRVFLFSDGWVNDGDVQEDDEILNKVNRKKLKYGITTSSFGVGSDFNRPLLNNMSIVGEGDFFYIDSSDRIEFVMNVAKRSYQSTIATRTKLLLYGLDIKKYLINNLYARGEIEYNTAVIDINDLRADDKKYIVIAMEIDTNNLEINNNVEILRWKLSFRRIMNNGENRKQEIEEKVKLEVVNDDNKVNINYDVMIHWELATQRVEDILIFEEETVKGNIKEAIIRKTHLIESLENKCKSYMKKDNINTDTIKLKETELKRHKLTLESLKTAEKTNSEKERRKAMLQQHSGIVRNVNSSFFHDEL